MFIGTVKIYVVVFNVEDYTAVVWLIMNKEITEESCNRAEKMSNKLSVVVPIVIYNGTASWKENTRFIRYFQVPDKDLKKYIPDFKYILVDVNRLDDELLYRLKSEVSYFFLLDKTNLREVEKASERIRTIFREIKDRYPGLSKLLGRYILGLLNYKGVEIE